jgi:hypothetical protein
MKDIAGADWKKSKGLHEMAMGRFFESTVEEMARRATSGKGTAQERFCDAYEYAGKRRREAARLFDDFKRSMALIQLTSMRREELLTDEELSVLTEGAREFIRGLMEFGNK